MSRGHENSQKLGGISEIFDLRGNFGYNPLSDLCLRQTQTIITNKMISFIT